MRGVIRCCHMDETKGVWSMERMQGSDDVVDSSGDGTVAHVWKALGDEVGLWLAFQDMKVSWEGDVPTARRLIQALEATVQRCEAAAKGSESNAAGSGGAPEGDRVGSGIDLVTGVVGRTTRVEIPGTCSTGDSATASVWLAADGDTVLDLEYANHCTTWAGDAGATRKLIQALELRSGAGVGDERFARNMVRVWDAGDGDVGLRVIRTDGTPAAAWVGGQAETRELIRRLEQAAGGAVEAPEGNAAGPEGAGVGDWVPTAAECVSETVRLLYGAETGETSTMQHLAGQWMALAKIQADRGQ